jgi:hypothetical protein
MVLPFSVVGVVRDARGLRLPAPEKATKLGTNDEEKGRQAPALNSAPG